MRRFFGHCRSPAGPVGHDRPPPGSGASWAGRSQASPCSLRQGRLRRGGPTSTHSASSTTRTAPSRCGGQANWWHMMVWPRHGAWHAPTRVRRNWACRRLRRSVWRSALLGRCPVRRGMLDGSAWRDRACMATPSGCEGVADTAPRADGRCGIRRAGAGRDTRALRITGGGDSRRSPNIVFVSRVADGHCRRCRTVVFSVRPRTWRGQDLRLLVRHRSRCSWKPTSTSARQTA